MKKSDYTFERELIVESLIALDDGDTITFSELSALTGIDLQFECNHVLQAALSKALNEHGRVFRNIRNIGYTKLNPSQVIEDDRAQRRIKSACDIGTKRLTSVGEEFENLTDQEKRRHNAKLASMAIIRLIGTEKHIRKIEEKVKDARESTLEARRYLEELIQGDEA